MACTRYMSVKTWKPVYFCSLFAYCQQKMQFQIKVYILVVYGHSRMEVDLLHAHIKLIYDT